MLPPKAKYRNCEIYQVYNQDGTLLASYEDIKKIHIGEDGYIYDIKKQYAKLKKWYFGSNLINQPYSEHSNNATYLWGGWLQTKMLPRITATSDYFKQKAVTEWDKLVDIGNSCLAKNKDQKGFLYTNSTKTEYFTFSWDERHGLSISHREIDTRECEMLHKQGIKLCPTPDCDKAFEYYHKYTKYNNVWLDVNTVLFGVLEEYVKKNIVPQYQNRTKSIHDFEEYVDIIVGKNHYWYKFSKDYGYHTYIKHERINTTKIGIKRIKLE